MTIKRNQISDTQTTLVVELDQAEMAPDHQQTVNKLSAELKIPGFRAGHTPLAVASKHLDPQSLSQAFLERIVPKISEQVLNDQQQPAVLRPDISVSKFVPYNQLEITISYCHTSKIELADYLKLPIKPSKQAPITAKEISDVIERLRLDLATAKAVKRATKKGDRIKLDFSATTDGQDLPQLSSKDHLLVLGQQSMPPGFEDKLIGAKIGQEVKFAMKLPQLASLALLSQLKVKFSCKIKTIEELTLPPVDDKLATKLGDYKTLKQLKDAISQQLKSNLKRQQELDLDNQIIEQLRALSQISLPQELVKEQLKASQDSQAQSLKQLNLSYPQWLKARGLSDQEHLKQVKKSLKHSLEVSFLLTEIAKAEKIKISDQEFQSALKAMVREPDKASPAVKGRLRGRLLAEATILFLRQELSQS